jgi:hypothetical protein
MKIFSACCILLGVALPVIAAQPSSSHATNPKPHAPAAKVAATTQPPAAPAAPAPAPAPSSSAPTPTSNVSLDAYIADLADQVPLSKTEQTDIKTYYLDDGAKLQSILSDASLSPLTQEQQIDALRDDRNAKIAALLADVGRQAEFLKIESSYRVALVELAAQGGLVPTAPLPNVPQPTSTPPADASKSNPNSPRADAAPGE